MSPALLNTIEVILNGLMTGVMYSLVALGFCADLQGVRVSSTMPRV